MVNVSGSYSEEYDIQKNRFFWHYIILDVSLLAAIMGLLFLYYNTPVQELDVFWQIVICFTGCGSILAVRWVMESRIDIKVEESTQEMLTLYAEEEIFDVWVEEYDVFFTGIYGREATCSETDIAWNLHKAHNLIS